MTIEPKIHEDGTPEWYTPDGVYFVQYAADHHHNAIRLYQAGEPYFEWSGTLDEAQWVVEAFGAAIAYARKEQKR